LALRIGSGWRGEIEQADKDIHEHQLGWRWRAPSDQIFIELGSDTLLKAEEEKVEVAPEVVDDLAITMRKKSTRHCLQHYAVKHSSLLMKRQEKNYHPCHLLCKIGFSASLYCKLLECKMVLV